jgi:hypothetical protein
MNAETRNANSRVGRVLAQYLVASRIQALVIHGKMGYREPFKAAEKGNANHNQQRRSSIDCIKSKSWVSVASVYKPDMVFHAKKGLSRYICSGESNSESERKVQIVDEDYCGISLSTKSFGRTMPK